MKTLNFKPFRQALLITALTLSIASCKKEGDLSENENPAEEPDEQMLVQAEESTQASASFDDVQDISFLAADDEDLATEEAAGRNSNEDVRIYAATFAELRLRIGHCATVTVVPNNNTYPKTVTIDFGDGCLCADGKFRKGAVIIHLTGPIRRSGSVMTITLRDFFLNRAHVEGTKIVSNLSALGNIKFSIQVTGGALTFPNGRGYQYQCMKHIFQVEGGTTRVLRDDVYKIEGRSATSFNGGLTVTLDTDEALVKKVICPWISKGILKIKINNRLLFLNFSAPNNGHCDNKALLSWNNGNSTRLITLP